MYYILERKEGDKWLPTNIILEGDYHKHICLINILAKDGIETRARRISEEDAYDYQEIGMKVMHAPEILKNVE